MDLVAAEMFTCVQKFQHCHKSTTLQLVYFVVYPSDKVALQVRVTYLSCARRYKLEFEAFNLLKLSQVIFRYR